QAAVVVLARVEAPAGVGERVVVPGGAVPAGVAVADVIAAHADGKAGGVHLDGVGGHRALGGVEHEIHAPGDVGRVGLEDQRALHRVGEAGGQRVDRRRAVAA